MVSRARSQQDFHPLVAFLRDYVEADFVPVLHEALNRKIVSPTQRRSPIATDFSGKKIPVMNPGKKFP
jgi:hypothetical protein